MCSFSIFALFRTFLFSISANYSKTTLLAQLQSLAMSANTKDYSDYAPDADGQAAGWQPDKEKFPEEVLDEQPGRRRTSVAEGQIKHNQLGWKRLTVGRCYLPSTLFHHIGCCRRCQQALANLLTKLFRFASLSKRLL